MAIEQLNTKAEIQALADAMWQLLDDMGRDGQSACKAAKAYARVAYEPFREPDAEMDYSLEDAQAIVADIEEDHGR